ncbi:Hydroxyisourate hydrolase [Dissoconium aciculare CBS 342.82]|jgi:5-hydroxyisourate hydrolase|uniref:5-hydroxyisourate hydrolase n=1 Tax=Dissoconium aciculare CBS 342.82 TaxID=1314786 RepID=A0A6J3MCV1_9PEZI|nr:Hydroxyisourate hydrolase [Dissoconium aciculare CBS 342.82]KAF1825419.1 Hydroxyisourate hydrolase [Dissoconium aciculare CBS 342.82]
MAESTKPFITCHVLDTSAGRPAAGIETKLRLVFPAEAATVSWSGVTDKDGRVTAWTAPASKELNDFVTDLKKNLFEDEQMVWALTFATEAYFGRGKAFWPEVELKFSASRDEDHYHVPLLLSPWSFTTYRGS